MKNDSIKKLFLLIAFLFTSFFSYSQKDKSDFHLSAGNSFRYSQPIQLEYNYGVGVYTDLDFTLVKGLSVRGDFGWNDFFKKPSSENLDLTNENMEDWEFSGGLRYRISMLYVEALTGYRTGFQDQTYTAGGGFVFGNFNIGASYVYLDHTEMINYKLTFFW